MILTKVDLEQNFCRPADNEIAVNTEAGLFIVYVDSILKTVGTTWIYF